MVKSLAGRTALVTGAARGIGRAIAEALANDGARVALVDMATADPPPGETRAFTADVSDWAQVQALVDEVGLHWGGVDILVNNAALVKTIARSDRMSPEAWERELAVNLTGPFYLTRLVLPGMVERSWGRIINVSSIAIGGLDRQAAYAASKSGLLGLTRTVAIEHAAHGVTCNAIAPGLIATDNVLAMPEPIRRQALGVIPTGRLGEPAEVAALVAFLARPEAAYINGAVIPIDGGASLTQMTLARAPRPDGGGGR